MSSPAQQALIEIRHLTKAFGRHLLYENLNLTVFQGEILTIMGGSGSGKSMLLKMILGLEAPTEGEILFEGQNIHTLDDVALRAVRKRMGMVFQGSALFDSLDVYDNIAYPIHEHFDYPEEKIAPIVKKRLEMVGLPGIEELMPDELPGGMKKRIGLARAIAIDPQVIFYDEPTAGLDPSNARRIDRLIVSMRNHWQVTSVLVTHELQSAFAVSDRIALLWENRLAFLGSAQEARQAQAGPIYEFINGTLET